MRVFALVGESGSGKSYRASLVADKHRIGYIIDDGILIGKGKIIAGRSAKREKTSMASVKRAIFMYDDTREEVKAAIKRVAPESILILGTSVDMVNLIAERLEVAPIGKYINIRDIATEDEISLAKTVRMTQGKHIIPVPAFEVKKSFSGYFIDPLKVFFKLKEGPVVSDKTIVRPTYSYMGEYVLAKSAVIAICRHETDKVGGVKCKDVKIETRDSGVVINIDILVKVGSDMRNLAAEIQRLIKTALEEMAGLVVIEVNITIASIEI